MDREIDAFEEFKNALPAPLQDQLDSSEIPDVHNVQNVPSLTTTKVEKKLPSSGWYVLITAGILVASFTLYLWSKQFKQSFEDKPLPSVLLPAEFPSADAIAQNALAQNALAQNALAQNAIAKDEPGVQKTGEVRGTLPIRKYAKREEEANIRVAHEEFAHEKYSRPNFVSSYAVPEEEHIEESAVTEDSIKQLVLQREQFNKILESDLKQTIQKFAWMPYFQ